MTPSAMAAEAVHWNNGLYADLIIVTDPDRARVDGPDRGGRQPEVVGDRRGELRFDDRDQMFDELRQVEIDHVLCQVRNAVLQRPAVDQVLRNRNVVDHVE